MQRAFQVVPLLGLAGALLAPGCGWAPTTRMADDSPGSVPGTHAGGPIDSSEKGIRAWVLGAAPQPESVTFLRWGPHRTAGLGREVKTYRVRWRQRDARGELRLHDRLFGVKGKDVLWSRENKGGDHWSTEDEAVNEAGGPDAPVGPRPLGPVEALPRRGRGE